MVDEGGKEVGVQSNSIMLAGTEKSSESPRNGRFDKQSPDGLLKITMKNEARRDKHQKAAENRKALMKASPLGKPIPTVDFLDMNKTFIKLDQTPDEDRSGPILKPSGAFRHTEYAKGFYKVNPGTQGAATATLESLEGSHDGSPFSDVER